MSFYTLDARLWGKKYKEIGKECQDYACSWFNNSYALVVVCDGAGSSQYSSKASKTIAEATKDFFCSNYDSLERNFDGIVPIPELQKSLLNKFRLVFSDLTNGNPSKLKDFHTTLIFGFADLITKRIYSGHIGDGILISFYENSYKIFSDSATGDISNQTFFVDTALGDSRLFRIKTEKIEQNNFIGFIAISDGVEEVWKYTKPLYKNNGMVINPDALQLFLYAEKLNEKDIEKDVLQDRIAKNSDDDCSLALLKISGKQCRVEYKEEIKKLEQIRGIEKNIGTEKVKEIDKNDEIEKKKLLPYFIAQIWIRIFGERKM
ncbi:MAG: protein phosphatase 2C domain-containing protein [Ignavibacteriales bacterium]|nr:protein phosphatase 2C domain-containing protein [Ignavibacteriales bacterium]